MSLQELPELIAWLAVVLPLFAGILGGWTLLYSPQRKFPDASRALGCSLMVGLAAGGVTSLFLWSFRGLSSDPAAAGPLEAIVPALGVSALVVLAAVGGYAFLARRGDGSAALIGVVLGPVILIGLPVVVATTVSRAIGL